MHGRPNSLFCFGFVDVLCDLGWCVLPCQGAAQILGTLFLKLLCIFVHRVWKGSMGLDRAPVLPSPKSRHSLPNRSDLKLCDFSQCETHPSSTRLQICVILATCAAMLVFTVQLLADAKQPNSEQTNNTSKRMIVPNMGALLLWTHTPHRERDGGRGGPGGGKEHCRCEHTHLTVRETEGGADLGEGRSIAAVNTHTSP